MNKLLGTTGLLDTLGKTTTKAVVPTGFHVMVSGHIESAQFHGLDNLYCKYDFNMGEDWSVVQGLEWGLSQIGRKGTGENTIVWNFPIDITFKSTNAFGWPRGVITIFGLDSLGRDIVRGYATMAIPTVPGEYTRYLNCFAPCTSSVLQEFMSWVTGNPPEYFNSKFITEGDGRDVTRVKSTGVVKVKLNVVAKGMKAFGFTVTS